MNQAETAQARDMAGNFMMVMVVLCLRRDRHRRPGRLAHHPQHHPAARRAGTVLSAVAAR